MCRLSALCSKNPMGKAHGLLFSNLLYISHLQQNTHGTGVACPGPSRAPEFLKTGESAETWVFSDEYLAFLSSVLKRKPRILVGHTRLASVDWRKAQHEEYPQWAAHPFLIGQNVLLFHNGIFKKHAELAAKHGIAKPYTDTMVFAKLLGDTTKGGREVTPAAIIEALAQVGKAEYAMLISDGDTLFMVRGDRDIYFSDTSLGLLINTAKVNLDNAVMRTSQVLAFNDQERIEVKEGGLVREWTIHVLQNGGATEVVDIPEEVREINSPKQVFFQPSAAQRAWTVVVDDDSPNVVEIYQKAERLVELEFMLSGLSERQIEEVVKTLLNTDKDWKDISREDLEGVKDTLTSFWAEEPEYAPSPDKIYLWREFEKATYHEADGPYKVAQALNPEFVFPFFHNTVEELGDLLTLLK